MKQTVADWADSAGTTEQPMEQTVADWADLAGTTEQPMEKTVADFFGDPADTAANAVAEAGMRERRMMKKKSQ